MSLRAFSRLPARRLPLAALLTLFALGICLRIETGPAHAALRVADDAPRAALWRRLYNALPACWKSERLIVVEEVSKREMERRVAEQEGRRDDSDSEVDGMYRGGGPDEDDPVTITLLASLRGEEAAMVFTHEYGHFVWEELLTETQRARYRRQWRRQRADGSLVTRYAEESSAEGFAETFAHYLRKPDLLRRRDRSGYGFLRDLEERAAPAEE